MHDAIALANLIYALPSNSTKDIEQAFSEYQAERVPHVMDSFKMSQMLSRFMNRGFAGAAALFIMKMIPQWMWRLISRKRVLNRPQCGYLSQVDLQGTVAPNASSSADKARAAFERRTAAAAI